MYGGVTVDSIRMRSHIKKTALVDAWGTLTTPLGSYSVIRSKETKISHDTTDAFFLGVWQNAIQTTADSVIQYTFWANGVGFPLVTATTDSAGAVTKVQWLKSLPATGINEYVAATEVNVYPNPAQDEITFDLESAKVISILVFDITGRIIDVYPVSNDKVAINTSAFANGAYLYSVVGKNNSILKRGKFTIAK